MYYRYWNGSSWGSWTSLPSGSAFDITAVIWPSGQADVYRVDYTNRCTVYVSHSTNGQTWGAWNSWASCGDQIAAAAMSDGTALFVLRATGNGNQAAYVYFNGTAWSSSFTTLPGITVNDLAITAYTNPLNNVKATLWAIGGDNCTVYYRNWNGTSWTNWASWAACYKQVSSFNTSDGGAYLTFIGTNNNYLYTERFTGSAWAGIVPQGAPKTWVAAAGVNIDDDTGGAYEHTENSDDCRTQDYNARFQFQDPNPPYGYFTVDTLNLAEIMYNEAQSETIGAQAMVGWTVRNRAYQALNSPSSCGSYPGAEGGGALTMACRDPNTGVPCNDLNFCDSSRRYCCAMHGGTTQLGTSGYQFNDEHVPFNTLITSMFAYRARDVLNGRLLDMSNKTWTPAGMSGCPEVQNRSCTNLQCTSGVNITELPLGGGPMEFLSHDYCAQTNGAPLSSCKWYAGDVCGNTDSNNNGNPVEVPLHDTCPPPNTSRGSQDNFFWNRQP